MPRAKRAEVIHIGGEAPTNEAEALIAISEPYTARVTLQGTSDLLFHRWSVEGVDEKARSAKGSKARKTDDIETYVWRNEQGYICLPGEYLRGTIINAARYRQDPRSPRKSAMDLFKAGIVNMTTLASLGVKHWDYEDRRRVLVQRAAVNRVRPAIKEGWVATIDLLVNLPEYISPKDLQDTITMGGKLVGLADFRPTYGRYMITRFEVL